MRPEEELLRTVIGRRESRLLVIAEKAGIRALTDAERESLRQVVADELVERGLGENDEPNLYGLQIEELIDWLGHV